MLSYEERMETMFFFVSAIVQNEKGFLKEKMMELIKQGISSDEILNLSLAARMYVEKRFKDEPIVIGSEK